MSVGKTDGGQGFVTALEKGTVTIRGSYGGRGFTVGTKTYTLRGLVTKLNKMIDANSITKDQAKVALDHILRLSIAPPPKGANLKWIAQCRKMQDVYKEIFAVAKKVGASGLTSGDTMNTARLLRDYLHNNPDVTQKDSNSIYEFMYKGDKCSPFDEEITRCVLDFGSKASSENVRGSILKKIQTPPSKSPPPTSRSTRSFEYSKASQGLFS
jgi:hypothetical protein